MLTQVVLTYAAQSLQSVTNAERVEGKFHTNMVTQNLGPTCNENSYKFPGGNLAAHWG